MWSCDTPVPDNNNIASRLRKRKFQCLEQSVEEKPTIDTILIELLYFMTTDLQLAFLPKVQILFTLNTPIVIFQQPEIDPSDPTQQDAALAIQTKFRQHAAKQEVEVIREEKAATKIQAGFRGHQGQTETPEERYDTVFAFLCSL